MLSRLSYGPSVAFSISLYRLGFTAPLVVGLGGLEPPTSPLSGVRSNRLSYRPKLTGPLNQTICVGACRQRIFTFTLKGGDPAAGSPTATLLRLHPSHEPYRGKRPPEG